eukprot:scaffold9393_cov66-Phaeocystis_antarctica.AAC.3
MTGRCVPSRRGCLLSSIYLSISRLRVRVASHFGFMSAAASVAERPRVGLGEKHGRYGWPARPKRQIGRGRPDLGAASGRLGPPLALREVMGSCAIRETTQTGCPWSRPRVSLSIYLSRPPESQLAEVC